MKEEQEKNLSDWGRKQWRNNRQVRNIEHMAEIGYVEELYETRNWPVILDRENETDIS